MIGEAVRVAETAASQGWISRRETLAMSRVYRGLYCTIYSSYVETIVNHDKDPFYTTNRNILFVAHVC